MFAGVQRMPDACMFRVACVQCSWVRNADQDNAACAMLMLVGGNEDDAGHREGRRMPEMFGALDAAVCCSQDVVK